MRSNFDTYYEEYRNTVEKYIEEGTGMTVLNLLTIIKEDAVLRVSLEVDYGITESILNMEELKERDRSLMEIFKSMDKKRVQSLIKMLQNSLDKSLNEVYQNQTHLDFVNRVLTEIEQEGSKIHRERGSIDLYDRVYLKKMIFEGFKAQFMENQKILEKKMNDIGVLLELFQSSILDTRPLLYAKTLPDTEQTLYW